MIKQRRQRKHHSMNHQSGFTLIELMIVVTLIIIIATVAVPGFNNMIQRNQTSAAANNLMVSLQTARSEAIKSRTRVTVCSRANPRTVPETCAGNNNWVTGWLVFVDADNSGTFNAGDTLLRVEDTAAGSPTFTGTVSNIQFLSNGLANAAASFTVTPTGCTNNQERIISVSATGSASVREDAC